MKKPETVFREGKVMPFIKKLPNTFHMSIQQVAILGDPDIILCINGKFVSMELKKDAKEKLRKLQALKARFIENAKGIALEVNPENWEETKVILKGLAK